MHSIPYTILSAVPMFICTFWAIQLLGQYAGAHSSKKVLFWFMLTAACLYFGHFVVFNHIFTLIPVTDTLYSFSTLSVYPLFYLYIQSLTGELGARHWLVLLPGTVLGGCIGIAYCLVPGDELQQLIASILYEKGGLPDGPAARLSWWTHLAMKYVILGEVICILPAGFRKLATFRKKVREYYSNTWHKDLKEVRNLLAAFVLTSCCSITADLIGRAFFVDSMVLMVIVLLPFSVLLYYIGYIGNAQGFTIAELQQEILAVQTLAPEEARTSASAATSSPDREWLKERINRLMEEKKLYLDPELKLSDLARQMNSNRTYVYEAIRSGNRISFSDYINRYRIRYSLDLLQMKEKKIEEISYESGFASKVAFYRNFKKIMGITPGEYQKTH